MGEQDDLAALGCDFGDGRRHPLDAGGIADLAVGHRHVEIDPEQHPLAAEIDVVEGSKVGHGQISLPIATAVSTMRLEKPHSLSYQDITRTSVPSMTLVWSMWKIDERGSWLKSMETLGWSV